MASYSAGSGEGRWGSSPRPKGRDNARNTLCRNLQIYGYCRNEATGCPYNHNTKQSSSAGPPDSAARKRFNVDSPSFTPAAPDTSALAQKPSGFSPRAASAAPFQPKTGKSALVTPPVISRHQSSEWSNQGIPEFVPQSFHQESAGLGDVSSQLALQEQYQGFDASGSYVDIDTSHHNAAPFNPYAQDASSTNGATIFAQQNAFTQPLNYHLYAPVGPHRENLLAYQRTAHDFFISETLRQDLARKAEATLQVLPNSSLPPHVEHFHSLVPLDAGSQRSTAAFGYNTWLYKVLSSKDGNYYALRRVEGFRLTTEKAISTIPAWKRIANASCVTILDCFTTRAFGDSSLIFITDYHPQAKTLAEQHFAHQHPRSSRPGPSVPEHAIWSYLVQITSALRTIHANNLTARLITPSKILLTGKNRVRLNANAVLDVVQYTPEGTPMDLLQLEDLRQLGRLTLALATATSNPSTFAPSQPSNGKELPFGMTPTAMKALEGLNRAYSDRLRASIASLLDAGNPSNPSAVHNATAFAASIADHALTTLDEAFHETDTLESDLMRELENGRLVRLMAKLGFINERPEYSPHDPSSATISPNSPASLQRAAWSETGDRYFLKLFRDYVFHQVAGEDGRPVVDLGHVITCLNKLDASSDEKIALVTRDEQNVIVVSYREVKRGLESAFQDLRSAGQGTGGMMGRR